MFQIKVVEKFTTNIVCSGILFFFYICGSCHVWDNVERYGTDRPQMIVKHSACALHAG